MAEIAGLQLIVPSSVAGSGVSVSASGKVTFTAATSVSVNGCFDSTYDNYLVVLIGTTTTATNIQLRWRASGSDASGSDYTRQRLRADSTTVSGARQTSQSSITLNTFGTTVTGHHHYVYGPALSQPTADRSVTVNDTSGARIDDHASTHSLSTAYDGFTLFPAVTYGMTGSLTIYGLSQ